MADLIASLVWSRLGAERDAEITCDALGAAMHDGGMCATTIDLARFGVMLLEGDALRRPDDRHGGRQDLSTPSPQRSPGVHSRSSRGSPARAASRPG
jgi:CubicO group peptidase (beta-lactamase class C family)